MSSPNLDLPLLPSAEQIRRREFATVRRGYDPDQVRDYLTQIADQVETLEKEIREARLEQGAEARGAAAPPEAKTQAEPQAKDDPYERVAKRMAQLIATADREAERIVEEAERGASAALEEATAKASEALDDARAEADRIRVDAQARAEQARQEGSEMLERARGESERVLSGLSMRRDEMVRRLQEMQSKLLSVAQDLEHAIDEPGAQPDHQDVEGSAEVEGPAEDAPLADEADGTFEEAPADSGDVWTSTDTDLFPLDLDFDDDDEDDGEGEGREEGR
jgi:DivIVA domain-containing protein